MVWGAFSGDKGRGDLYVLPNNVAMRGDNYLRVLDHHMLPFWDIRRCNNFMQDGALTSINYFNMVTMFSISLLELFHLTIE